MSLRVLSVSSEQVDLNAQGGEKRKKTMDLILRYWTGTSSDFITSRVRSDWGQRKMLKKPHSAKHFDTFSSLSIQIVPLKPRKYLCA